MKCKWPVFLFLTASQPWTCAVLHEPELHLNNPATETIVLPLLFCIGATRRRMCVPLHVVVCSGLWLLFTFKTLSFNVTWKL